MISFAIPVPPSVNALHRAIFRPRPKGAKQIAVIKSAAYRRWRARPELAVHADMVDPPYRISIAVPISTRGDIDNRIKPILDWLQDIGVIDNDRNVDALLVHRAERDDCLVTVESLA